MQHHIQPSETNPASHHLLPLDLARELPVRGRSALDGRRPRCVRTTRLCRLDSSVRPPSAQCSCRRASSCIAGKLPRGISYYLSPLHGKPFLGMVDADLTVCSSDCLLAWPRRRWRDECPLSGAQVRREGTPFNRASASPRSRFFERGLQGASMRRFHGK